MARVLIKKEERIISDGRKKVVSDLEKHYVDSSKDFHSKHGVIRKDELQRQAGSVVESGKAKFSILDADFIDDYKHMKRSAQIIGLKDIGHIITNAGINKNSRILEAGVGSGALTCYLASIAKNVVSYDLDERSLVTARENVTCLSLKNVTIKEGSIFDSEKISESGFDVFVLDLPDPWRAWQTANKSLKIGGFLAVYLPNVLQVQQFVISMPENFLLERTIEVIEREWVVDDMRSRPATKDHAHTGFLTFVRRLS